MASVPLIKNSFFDCSKSLELYTIHKKYDLITNKSDNYHLFHIGNVKSLSEVIFNECDQCNIRSYSKLWLLKHNTKHINKDKKRKYTNSTPIRSFKRNQFTNSTNSKQNLQQLTRLKHVRNDKLMWLPCEKCDYKTNYRLALNFHMMFKHSTIDKKFKCDQCRYVTDTKSHLKSHSIYKHSANDEALWFTCDICQLKIKYKYGLKLHMSSVHSIDKELYKCTECNYQAGTERCLIEHITAKHTPDDLIKWYKCSMCDYKAKQHRFIKNHIKFKHLVCDKEFKCNQCLFATTSQCNLNRHINAKHTSYDEATWFTCDKCNWKTKWQHSLKRHTIKAHSEKKRNEK